MDELTTTDFDSFLRNVAICLTTTQKNGAGNIYGSGILYKVGELDFLIITAKHCLFDNKKGGSTNDIESVEVWQQCENNNIKKKFIPNVDIKITEGEQDVAIISLIDPSVLQNFLPNTKIWKIGFDNLEIRSQYSSYGFPAQNLQFIPRRHNWTYWQALYDPHKGFTVIAEKQLAAGEDVTAQEHLEGYSGAGLFLRQKPILVGIVVKLFHKSGVGNEAISLGATEILEALEKSGYRDTIQTLNLSNPPKIKYEHQPKYYPRLLKEINETVNDDPLASFFLKKESAPNLLQALSKSGRVMIIADGGWGKSVELTELAAQIYQAENNQCPWLIDLRYHSTISLDEEFKRKYPKIHEYDSQPVLIIDGYEEAGTQRDVFRKQLLSYIKGTNILVVVSCREAHFTPEEWPAFKTYSINPLELSDIEQYLKKQGKDESKIKELIQRIKELDLLEVASVPFYLDQINELFDAQMLSDETVSVANVLEKLVAKRADKDRSKKALSVMEQVSYTKRNAILERVAMQLARLNKFTLEIRDLAKFLTIKQIALLDFDDIVNIRSGIFDFKSSLFKDFFAALYLSKLSAKEVIKTIRIHAKYPQIAPGYRKAVAFLAALWRGKPRKLTILLDWILDNEPAFLSYIARQDVPNKYRQDLLRQMIASFQTKDAHAFYYSWNWERVSRFCASEEANQLIIGLVSSNQGQTSWYSPIYWLQWTGRIPHKRRIEQFLKGLVPNLSHTYDAIFRLEQMERLTSEDALVFVENWLGSENKGNHNLAFSLILNHQLSDRVAEKLISELKKYSRLETTGPLEEEGENGVIDIRQHSILDQHLLYCLLALRSQTNLTKLIDTLASDHNLAAQFLKFEFMDEVFLDFWKSIVTTQILKKQVLLNKLFSLFSELLFSKDQVSSQLGQLFIVANKGIELVQYLEQKGLDRYAMIKTIGYVDSEGIRKFLAEKYQNQKSQWLDSSALDLIRNTLPFNERVDFASSIDASTHVFGIMQTERDNYQRIKHELEIQRLEIFFNAAKCRSEIERILDAVEPNASYLRYSDLAKAENEDSMMQYGPFSTMIIIIEGYMRFHLKTKERVLSFFDDHSDMIKLKWIKQRYETNMEDIYKFKDQIQTLLNSCVSLEMDSGADFYYEAGEIIYHFWTYLNCDIPDDAKLKLILLSFPGGNIDRWLRIRDAVGVEKCEFQVYENLENESLSDSSLNAQLEYCKHFGFRDSLDLLEDYIKSGKWNQRSNFVIENAIDTINLLTRSDNTRLERIWESSTEAQNLHLLRILIDRGSTRVIPKLQSDMQVGDDEESKFEAAVALLKYGDSRAIKEVVKYLKNNDLGYWPSNLGGIRHAVFFDYLPYLVEIVLFLDKYAGYQPTPLQSINDAIRAILLKKGQFKKGMKAIKFSPAFTSAPDSNAKRLLQRLLVDIELNYYLKKYESKTKHHPQYDRALN